MYIRYICLEFSFLTYFYFHFPFRIGAIRDQFSLLELKSYINVKRQNMKVLV